MASKQVRLSRIRANPFRDLLRYPINDEKIERLRESIRTTGFWGNVLVRDMGDGYELAYGHHRLVALRKELQEDQLVDVIVRDLSDEEMLRIMARENDEVWHGDVRVDQETARAAVAAFADGRINLPEVDLKAPSRRKDRIRYAPSFLQGEHPATPPDASYPYTSETLKDFLGWGIDRTERVLRSLEDEEKGWVDAKLLKGLDPRQAAAVVQVAHEAGRDIEGEEGEGLEPEKRAEKARRTAMRVAEKASKALKEDDAASKKARAVAREVLDKEREKRKKPPPIDSFAKRLETAIDKLLTHSDKLKDKLWAVIENRDSLDSTAKKNLVRALRELSVRTTKAADGLEGKGKVETVLRLLREGE